MHRPNDDNAPAWLDEPEGPAPAPSASSARWKVIVVDDEPAVHSVSRLALHRLQVDGVPLELHYAESGSGGREVLRANPDAALLLLDVVMESTTPACGWSTGCATSRATRPYGSSCVQGSPASPPRWRSWRVMTSTTTSPRPRSRRSG